MSEMLARNVVLGAGAMGAAAAYHLAKRGEPVLLVEQFALGHDRGSSHGEARITRHSYADPACAALMPAAFAAWRQLEADAGEPFFLRTGGLSVSPPGVGYVGEVAANLETLGVPLRRMTGAELNRAIPPFGVPADSDVVFEPDAGMLAAARIVKAEVALAKHFGGGATQVLENCPVHRVDLDGDRPTLHVEGGTIVAERLIVAAGAWMPRLVPAFAGTLRPTRQQVLYFEPPDPVAYGPGRLPVFVYKGAGEADAYYGMPAHGGLGVKFARHDGPDTGTDPDRPDSHVSDEYRGSLRAFLYTFLPELTEAHVARTEVCLYTMAPGEVFQVGLLEGRSDVVVASPCSGHGFKFSCLIGRALADLATTGSTDLEIAAWRPELGNP